MPPNVFSILSELGAWERFFGLNLPAPSSAPFRYREMKSNRIIEAKKKPERRMIPDIGIAFMKC